MRKALATLPWVEQGSVKTDIRKQEVRFKITERASWNEANVRAELQKQGFDEMTVIAAPK